MAIEKRWDAIAPRDFTANGTSLGIVTISTTAKYRTKQEIFIAATGEETLALEVKRILSPTQMRVGPRKGSITTTTDLSLYTTAKTANVYALEQARPVIQAQEHERAVFEEEPVVAKRVWLVDNFGEAYDQTNPLPVATPSANPPGTPSIYRVAYLTAGTEQSIAIPAGTSKIYIGDSELKSKMRIAYTANDTIDLPGGGGKYTTVFVGNAYERDGLLLTGKTLYYQANRSNIMIEIEFWQ